MNLAVAERLLGMLVASPDGVRREVAAAQLGGADCVAAAAATLVERGHPLQMANGGWRLECAGVHFDPELFDSARPGAGGVEVHERAVSTNDLAREGASRGAADGALWLAESQTGGRGRQGRVWHCAPHSGLLVSWLVRAPLDAAARPSLLPLAFGLGVCEGVRGATGLAVRTKWPNDLWFAGRKLAGLLVEARHGATPHAVVGLGMNVGAGAVSSSDLPAATTLAAAGVTMRREILLAAILAACAARLADWKHGRHAAIAGAWRALDVTVGREVRVQTASGVLAGRVGGITESGLLELQTGAGTNHQLAAGEVHLL